MARSMMLSSVSGAALIATLGLAITAAPLAAKTAEAKVITVTATRVPTAADDAPATVTVITDEEIEENLVTDIKDLIRFEPGVSVRTNPARFSAALAATGRDANSGFNIRGLEGDRVLIQVDGIRVPDSFAFGAQSVGRGDYVDLGLLKSVEILRGPASALYGSDGVAGVVSFITKDPSDILEEGDAFEARARLGYSSADTGWSESGLVALRGGLFEGLIAVSRRDEEETDNQGTNDAPNTARTTPNPQDTETTSALGKLIFRPSDAQRFRLTAEILTSETETEVLSARAVPPLSSTSTLDLDALDERERLRISFDHRTSAELGLFDSAYWAVYFQQSETRQFSDEDRNTAADRKRDNTFDNQVFGLTAQSDKVYAIAGLRNHIVYGLEASQTRQEGVRDGTVPPAGETFPTRPFPNTDYVLAGLFVQNEVELWDGKLSLFPALRYDYYDLSPEPDALFPSATANQSDDHLSPKLGLVVWPTDHFGVFVNYAAGFKAPTPSQVNNGFTNIAFNYTSVPNPDLKPETSQSFEGGVRLRDMAFSGATWRADATAFTADYEDFIEQVQVGGSFTPLDPAEFQYVNLGNVEIWGLEGSLRGEWENGLALDIAASFAEGDQSSGGASAPLASIEPLKVVSSLGYDSPGGRFGGAFIVTHSARKESDRVGSLSCGANCFVPEAFTILDATAYLDITEHAALRLAVFNVMDEKYWWWGDVRGLSGTSTVTDAYTQPGRNFSASLTVRF